MATMLGSAGYAEIQVSIDNAQAYSLIDMGFSEADLSLADHLHISVKSGNLNYWYGGNIPTQNEGHPAYEREKIIIRGIRNIRNFKTISSSQSAAIIAITLGRF